MKNLFIGVDISARELVASFFDDNSNPVISSAKYPNTPDGWREFSKLLSSLSKDYKIVCGLESTGDFHIGILHTLQAMDNIEVHQLNPASVRYFAKALNVSAKTDRIDAQIIARYLATIKPQGDYHIPLFLQRLRHLVRTRRTFIENMASLKNQLYHILRIYFPGYRILVKSGLPISFLHILQRFPSPHLILGAGEEELMKIRVGRQKIRRSIVRKVIEVARSAPIQELTEAEMLIIKTIVRQILEINGTLVKNFV